MFWEDCPPSLKLKAPLPLKPRRGMWSPKTEEQDGMHYWRGIDRSYQMNNMAGERKAARMEVTLVLAALCVWCASAFTSRTSADQRGSRPAKMEVGGGTCGWMEEFLQKGITSVHARCTHCTMCANIVPQWQLQASLLSPHVKLEQAVTHVTSPLLDLYTLGLCGLFAGRSWKFRAGGDPYIYIKRIQQD